MPARTVGDASFYYEESGKGLPLVLLHGFPLDSRVWKKQREALGHLFHVITPDLRGFGKSLSAESFTLGSLADDVHALLAEMKSCDKEIRGALELEDDPLAQGARWSPARIWTRLATRG